MNWSLRRVPLCAILLAAGIVLAPQPAGAEPAAGARSRLMSLINRLRGATMPEGIAKSNGRIEATQIDVAAKYPGRIAKLSVKEGDDVSAGQVVATISSPETEAQLRGAQAQVLRAKKALAEAVALIAQRRSVLTFAETDFNRGKELVGKGYMTKQVFDQRKAAADAARAALDAAVAQEDQAKFAVQSAEADVQRLEAMLVDLVLRAPRDGRVQYRLAREGEVVGAGTRVLTLLDLADVYMTIYLPAAQAGPLALNDEARIILDPVPQYVVPATISFVAADAQFTPKSVETAEEREKLTFRIKLQIDPQVLKTYRKRVKTGVRGLGFVRTKPDVAWPADLAVRLP
ncbi:HlyD family secretion protein [Methylobacterium radiodurans]|uniref:Efflux transporter periplasmic adaptor subunit n=1 Tax=Methylobacterium radiodurans TaxID=2202828 RepID=A0A2U8VRE0_9HYPH|nr:HlyD family efflux transporter periplasmic adaptor subunit [Methylobacterium radiodurans]AWN36339.1 efflux transporter periplasmic adaptor subunit [Methylobacterium radiodurans]